MKSSRNWQIQHEGQAALRGTLEAALDRIQAESDGDFEAHLSRSVQAAPRARPLVVAPAGRMVELVDAVSYDPVLKKTKKPWKKQQWVIPQRTASPGWSRCLRPYDPRHPVVCMDESPRQLIRETRLGCRPRGAGTPRLRIRTCERVHGRRAVVQIRERRTDWAHFLNDCPALRLRRKDYPREQSEYSRPRVAL